MTAARKIQTETPRLPDASAIEVLAAALTEYEIARAMADHQHPDNEGARILAAHKFTKVKTALAAFDCNKKGRTT